jgi:non-ribosomal peptide synthetase component E (peptide arylation enzyme)
MTTPYYHLAYSVGAMQPQQRNLATAEAGGGRRLADTIIVRVIASCAFATSLFALVYGALQLTVAL